MTDAKIVIERVRNASARKASAGLNGFFGFFGGRPPPAPTFVLATPVTHAPPSDVASLDIFCESERDACTRSARLCGCNETGARGVSHERGVGRSVEDDSEEELLVCIQIY